MLLHLLEKFNCLLEEAQRRSPLETEKEEDKLKTKFVVLLTSLFLAMCITSTLFASPIQWEIADGGNGHWYEVIQVDDVDGIQWDEANSRSISSTWNGFSGNLASITSLEENKFVSGLVNDIDWGNDFYGPWLGGTGFAVPDPTIQDQWIWTWSWSDGEAWGYESWASDQPNGVANITANETYYLHYFPAGDAEIRTWNDTQINGFGNSRVFGYVVEYPTPEPATLFLFGFGLLGLAGIGRKKQ